MLETYSVNNLTLDLEYFGFRYGYEDRMSHSFTPTVIMFSNTDIFINDYLNYTVRSNLMYWYNSSSAFVNFGLSLICNVLNKVKVLRKNENYIESKPTSCQSS